MNAPLLFLVFNRPDTTAIVFETIRQAKPKQLFVAADGPRLHKEGELEKCAIARKIATNVDWDCEVKILFRDENKGCGLAVSEAITWFFEHVEQGIILEDDVLPSVSFFRFCEELLEKYKDEHKVMHIGANNLLVNSFTIKESYVFTMYSGAWGWATWRRAWNGYDYTMSSWTKKANKQKLKNSMSGGQFLYLDRIFNQAINKDRYNAWSYQWIYHRLMNAGISIIPSVNLTINIGFNEEATHTKTATGDFKSMALGEIAFPLIHPASIVCNNAFDKKLSQKYAWVTKSILKKIINRLSKILGIDIKL